MVLTEIIFRLHYRLVKFSLYDERVRIRTELKKNDKTNFEKHRSMVKK